jgi:hypothetical protein
MEIAALRGVMDGTNVRTQAPLLTECQPGGGLAADEDSVNRGNGHRLG